MGKDEEVKQAKSQEKRAKESQEGDRRYMADMMTFPETAEEFMEQYKIVDDEGIYMSKGSELVPIFRMNQWFAHIELLKDKEEAEMKELKESLNYYRKRQEEYAKDYTIAKQNGIIEGLKFAIRCDSISGGEVND